MQEFNIHGNIFKRIREDRGLKLKDVAGDVISTRTLIRFEADETSVTLATFDRLLNNCGIGYIDYFGYLHKNHKSETEILSDKFLKLLSESNRSGIVSEAIKLLKRDEVSFELRVFIEFFLFKIRWERNSELLLENERIVKEHLKNIGRFSLNELLAFLLILSTATVEDFPIDYVSRIIEEGMEYLVPENQYDQILGTYYIDILINGVGFLTRNGELERAEKYCNKALKILNEKRSLPYVILFIRHIKGVLLPKIYLSQNKVEGVEMANKYMRYLEAVIEFDDLSEYKLSRDALHKEFYELNKTGISFDF